MDPEAKRLPVAGYAGSLFGESLFAEHRRRDRRETPDPLDRRLLIRGPDRRHGQRRKAGRIVRAGILALLALAIPKGGRPILQSRELVEVLTSDWRIADQRQLIERFIEEAAATYGVRPDLVRAVIQVESGFNPSAISRVGALGLMQLMPGTARELGVEDPLDPQQNILGGAKYLSHLIERFEGNVALAVAGYNAGPNAVRRYRGKIPPYRETRGYVKKVRAAQHDWLRESGQAELEPFEIHPALFHVEPKRVRGKGIGRGTRHIQGRSRRPHAVRGSKA
jgi:hypothetical protein